MPCRFGDDGQSSLGRIALNALCALRVWADPWTTFGWMSVPAPPCRVGSGRATAPFGVDGTAHAQCCEGSNGRWILFGADGTAHTPCLASSGVRMVLFKAIRTARTPCHACSSRWSVRFNEVGTTCHARSHTELNRTIRHTGSYMAWRRKFHPPQTVCPNLQDT